MSEQGRARLGTISIWLAGISLLALISWFVINPPCGSLLRSIIENIVIWGTAVAVPFGIVAVRKEKPGKRAWIGLSLSLVPLACFIVLVAAIVYAVATGSTGIPGTMELLYSGTTGTQAALEPGVFISTETKYYDVSGSTGEELSARMQSLSPHGFAAETRPVYLWTHTFRTEGGSCRIERVRVDALITFTYPRLTNPNADQNLTEQWEKSFIALEEHEKVHEEIDRKASQEIYDTLVRLPPAPSCSELEKEINERAQEVIAKEKESNDEFDLVTDHGRLRAGTRP